MHIAHEQRKEHSSGGPQPTRHRSPRAATGRRTRTPILTMKQIERRYNGEWVLIVNPVVDKLMRVVRGELAYHSKKRDEVDRVALERRDQHVALLHIGPPPKDLTVVF